MWSTRSVKALGDVASITCPFESTCFASGTSSSGAVLSVSTDAGASWMPASLPSGVSSLGPVACDSAGSVCLATTAGSGAQVLRSTDSGATWSMVAVASPTSGDALSAVACSSPSSCTAVGSSPPDPSTCGQSCPPTALAATSTDAGATWMVEQPKVPFAQAGFSGLGCSAAMHCVTSGESVDDSGAVANAYLTTDGGSTWSSASRMPGAWGATVWSCESSTCWGTGSNFETGCCGAQPHTFALLEKSSDGGGTWKVALDAPSDILSIDGVASAADGALVLTGTNVDGGPVLAVVAK